MKNMNGAKRCPAVAVAAVILGMGFCMAAQAQSYDDNYDYSPSYGHRIVDRSLARDPDNGIRTLKAGQAAQERRFAARGFDLFDPFAQEGTQVLFKRIRGLAHLLVDYGRGCYLAIVLVLRILFCS